MAKSIRLRINDSFDDDAREDLMKYMEWLRSNMQDVCQVLRRTVALVLLLMAAFVLVSESSNAKISIGSFQISNGSVVIIFIPALVAYLYLQTMSDSAQLDSLEIAFTAALAKWSAKAERNDLGVLILPSQALYWNISASDGYSDNQTSVDKARNRTANIILVAIIIGMFAFEGWAYYKLYHSPVIHDVAWIISVCIAIFCLIAGVIQFLGDELYLVRQ